MASPDLDLTQVRERPALGPAVASCVAPAPRARGANERHPLCRPRANRRSRDGRGRRCRARPPFGREDLGRTLSRRPRSLGVAAAHGEDALTGERPRERDPRARVARITLQRFHRVRRQRRRGGTSRASRSSTRSRAAGRGGRRRPCLAGGVPGDLEVGDARTPTSAWTSSCVGTAVELPCPIAEGARQVLGVTASRARPAPSRAGEPAAASRRTSGWSRSPSRVPGSTSAASTSARSVRRSQPATSTAASTSKCAEKTDNACSASRAPALRRHHDGSSTSPKESGSSSSRRDLEHAGGRPELQPTGGQHER
jgi:hypothetical protein